MIRISLKRTGTFVLLRRRRDMLQSRSLPVLGHSNVQLSTSPGKCDCVRMVEACCARGRAHSGVVRAINPAVILAVSGFVFWASGGRGFHSSRFASELR